MIDNTNINTNEISIDCNQASNSLTTATWWCNQIEDCNATQHFLYQIDSNSISYNYELEQDSEFDDYFVNAKFIHYTLLYNTSNIFNNDTQLFINDYNSFVSSKINITNTKKQLNMK